MLASLHRWLPTLLWCSLIWLLSCQHGGGPHVIDPGFILYLATRKAGHLVEFGVLFLLARHALSTGGRSEPAANLFAFLLCVAYGALDEWHQCFVPGRLGCWQDVLIDAVGALIARRWGEEAAL